jgi:tetratricopeptide (TPR) repeat protein
MKNLLYFLLGFWWAFNICGQQDSQADVEREMSLIEPGFVPKDDRAIQLYLLNKLVNENSAKIKSNHEEAQRIRSVFSQKYREDLNNYIDKRVFDVEGQVQTSRVDIIKQYEIALKNHPKSKAGADALYVLGWLYYEVDEKDYHDRLETYQAASDRGEPNLVYPEENFRRTIDAYEQLIARFPNYPYLDNVYYLYGLSLWHEGAFYSAVAAFQDLIKKYPKSRFVEEVWFRLGEFFYDVDEFDDAIRAYDKIISNPTSQYYDKALYKIAWSYFQKDRYAKSIEYFSRVLILSYEGRDSESNASLRAEAGKYIIKNFNEEILLEQRGSQSRGKVDREYAERLGRILVERVTKRFSDLPNKQILRDLLLLAATSLLDDGKTDAAILALEGMIKQVPLHPENPLVDAQIARILEEAERFQEARAHNNRLIETYRKDSAWSVTLKDNFTAMRHAREAVRDAMLSLAVYFHKTAKELKEAKKSAQAAEFFERAHELYLRYLIEYPEREDTYQAIFYLAEASYEVEKYQDALEAYQLIKSYPLPIPGSIRRDATFNIVFTFRHVLEEASRNKEFKEIDFDGLTSKLRGLEQEEIPPMGAAYLSAIDEFLRIAPEDKQVPVLLFHAAAIYYVYGHLEEALTRFFFIIDTYPKSAAAAVAARLVLDDAVAKEEWARAAELAKKFREQNLGGKSADFARIEGNAKFKMARQVFETANELNKQGQITEAKAKYQEAAGMFAKLLQEDPKNPHADLMLFNQARAVVESGTSTQALPLYRKLYTQYPSSEFAKQSRFQEALTLEKMLMFSAAAAAYDGIIKIDPQSEAAGDAMLNKALLYEAAEDLPKANAAFLEFAKRYPNRPESPDALLTIAANHKKMGRPEQQIAALEQFIRQYSADRNKRPEVIEAHAQIAATYEDMSKKGTPPATLARYQKALIDHYRKAVQLYSPDLNSPLAAFYAAKAQLILEKPEHQAFLAMRIKGRTGKAQSDELQAMMKKLSELSQKNEAVIKAYAQPVYNAESLWRIGQLYAHLADSMLRAPCPRDVAEVDEFACDEYIVLLEDKARILEDKAMDAYKQAYEIALSAYDAPPALVEGIGQSLNRLRPGQFQQVGNAIDARHEPGLMEVGRMLSTGRMASELHANEADPDVTKPVPEIVVPPVAPPETPATNVEEKP